MTQDGDRKRGSGSRIVHARLRDEILDLKLQPGSLLDEVALAERFAVSRTPVREALVRLAGEGLVTTLPNRSTIVSAIDFLNLASYFDALVLMYRVTSRLAATHYRSDDLEAIRARQADFRRAADARDALGMIATNAAMHLAIAEAGRNPYFTALFGRLLDEGRRLLRLYYQSYGDDLPERFVDEHESMIAAIEARDADAAERLGRLHAEQIVEQLARLLVPETRLDIEL